MSASERQGSFTADIEAIRQRARQHIENGAVTEAYRGNRETVIKVLNEALATELVCVLRYKRHHYAATGIHAQAVADEFLEHAKEEQGHADMIAERITQLGGEPDLKTLIQTLAQAEEKMGHEPSPEWPLRRAS